MPSETLQGVVLRHANYRERDRMLTLLTPDHGRVDVLARGCRRPNSPLMPAAELFVHGEFVVFRNNDRCTLTSCTLADTFFPLRLDPYRLTCGAYLLNLALAAYPRHEPALRLKAQLLRRQGRNAQAQAADGDRRRAPAAGRDGCGAGWLAERARAKPIHAA